MLNYCYVNNSLPRALRNSKTVKKVYKYKCIYFPVYLNVNILATCLVSVCSGHFMELSCVLPTTQFGTCDALLCMSHTLQSALDRGQEARIAQIDFSEALDRVNHQGILYKLCSVGIGGSVLSILTQFLSNRSQHDMGEGYRSKLVNVVSGVPQRSVLGPLLYLLYTSELFSILDN